METNLLDLIPLQKIKFEESQDGLITLLKPKFRNKFMLKYVLHKLKNPNYKVRLDDFGSFVWKHCDGKTTVQKIGELLKENFKENIDPVYDRLAIFMQTLMRYKFIEYKDFKMK